MSEITKNTQMGHRMIDSFKAYDVRGRLGVDLDEDIAYRIGRAFGQDRDARRVVVGRDSRDSSPALAEALIEGLTDGGCDVLDLGFSGTEEVYFATGHYETGGGIEVTASHNPIDYNGFKMVGPGSAPLSPDIELAAIQALAEGGNFGPRSKGKVTPCPQARAAYAKALVDFVDVSVLRPMKIVVNAGNGTAGPTFDVIAEELAKRGAPVEFLRINHNPDSRFPNGIPNPLLDENQHMTADPVREHDADLGVAWDGDFDRCFFFDDTGRFIPGEYIVGLLAEAFLEKSPGEKIVHDPRVIMNTRAVVAAAGGEAVQSRTGHAFVKRTMRDTGAIYGGEMSAHHYFRDFFYCDSGMIPWLLMIELLSRKGCALTDLLSDHMTRYPSSGEVNFRLDDPDAAIARIDDHYRAKASAIDTTDGISYSFNDGWRFNLRKSNTEPVVRLNLESDGQVQELAARKAAVIDILMAQ